MAKFYRHGDLSFRRVNVEMGGKPVKKLVLAEGEHTGHFHQLEAFEGATIYSTPFQEAEGVPTRYVKIVGGGGDVMPLVPPLCAHESRKGEGGRVLPVNGWRI